MLTDLSFLEVGAAFPPEDSHVQARLELIKKNRLLFECRADEVYERWVEILRDDMPEKIHDVLGFPRRLAFLWPSLVVGEPPEFTAPGDPAGEQQQLLTRFVKDTGLVATTKEVLTDASRFGEGLYRLRLEDGEVRVEPQPPDYWFPVVSESNIKKVLYHVLAWTFLRTEETSRMERWTGAPDYRAVTYLRCEIHEAGRIEHRIYRLNKDARIEERVEDPGELVNDWPAEADGEGIEETGADTPLVFHVPNRRTSERLHGLDDYTPIDSHIEKIGWMRSMRMAVLDKHQDPVMSGPPPETMTLPDGRTVVSSGGRYYPMMDNDSPRPEYHVFDGKAEMSFEHEKTLWESVYQDSETSPAAFGHSEMGAAESGTSMRLRMAAPLKKAEDIVQSLEPVVLKLIETAGQLAGVDFSEVSITWRDGLPEDEREQSEISERDVRTGIRSRKSEMKRRYRYNDKQAEEELAQMADEEDEPDPIETLARQLNGNGRG